MLKDCLQTFESLYKKNGEDDFLLDSYILAEGTYILVDDKYKVDKVLEVNKSKDKIDTTDKEYRLFCEMDYYSKLIDTNKAIDTKKIILSNNLYSFWIKKENLSNGKLTSQHISNYYEVLANPEKKYNKNKKSKELYEETKLVCGEVDKDKLEANQKWIQDNIFNILQELNIKGDKGYLKIFFEASRDSYKNECSRYLIPNIYNTTEYNIKADNKVMGLPNNNLGMNSKKPYLKHKTRQGEIPYLINSNEAMLQYKFFEYLMNLASQGKNNVYIDELLIKGIKNDEFLKYEEREKDRFSGVYLRIQKGKEVEIIDYSTVIDYQMKLEGIEIRDSFDMDYGKYEPFIEFREVSGYEELARIIDKCFFGNILRYNYFGDLQKTVKEEYLKVSILESREAFFNWFYKGEKQAIRALFSKVTLRIIYQTIIQNRNLRAREQWVLRDAINCYLKDGGESMADIMKPVLETLEKKTLNKQEGEITIIESDEEYYCAVGQLSNYLLSLSKASEKKHSDVNPILECANENKLMNVIKGLFIKYNYQIKPNSRFNKLYAMVIGYVPTNKVNHEALLYGYLQGNLIYKKVEKDDENKDSVDK